LPPSPPGVGGWSRRPRPDVPRSVAPQTPNCWTMACAGQEPGNRRWPSGYDSFISPFQSPPKLIPLRHLQGSRQEGTGFSRPCSLERGPNPGELPPTPPGCHNGGCVACSPKQAGEITSRKGALGPWGHRTPARERHSILAPGSPAHPRGHLPQNGDQSCLRRWPWARGPRRPAGAPLLRNVSLSVHIGHSHRLDVGGTEVFRPADGSQLPLWPRPQRATW